MLKMDYDFSKICRVCLAEGIMMSIFKVHISKKIMACSSVQVWQNDGLPAQICNKCVAKLHISFQFKKQCEKSDAKLRQYLSSNSANSESNHNAVTNIPQTNQNNCVYVECVPSVDINNQEIPQETQKCHFENGLPVTNTGPILSQLNYNNSNLNIQIPTQSHVPLTNYNLQSMNQIQFPPMYNVPTLNVTQEQLPVSSNNNILALGVSQMQPNQLSLTTTGVQIPLQQQQSSQVLEQVGLQIKDEKVFEKPTGKLKKDERLSSADQNKQCTTCGKIFLTGTKLSRHMKTHSTDMPYKCRVCHKAFAHSGNYKIHLRMHTDERPFRCSVCDKGCRQAQDLEKHMRTHTGERPHQCTLCPRAFSTSSNLIAHIRTHTGERPYVCCVCQKAFCQSNELTKHMRTHTGEKSHICSVCQKGFNGSSTLIVHMRSHTGERPYVCTKCNKGFAQSSCLAVHMKRHSGEKNFHCTECDRSFVVNADLKEHMLTHSGDRPYGCNVCDKRYSRANDLNRHAKTHSL